MDTAFLYENGVSETILQKSIAVNEASLNNRRFSVATKANPWSSSGKSLSAESVVSQLNTSLDRLKTNCVDIFYLHAPDHKVPIETTLSACQQLYKEGKFKELGLSNYPAWMVVYIWHYCKANGWVVPTVYQGMYNALTRDVESELIPALRKLNIRFYAFNPLAGGLLTSKYSDFEHKPKEGRFIWRKNYVDRYWKPSYFTALQLIKTTCDTEGISMTEAAFRWLLYHSKLKDSDGVILGFSTMEQYQQNSKCFREAVPLPSTVVKAFDKAWKSCKAECPRYFQ